MLVLASLNMCNICDVTMAGRPIQLGMAVDLVLHAGICSLLL